LTLRSLEIGSKLENGVAVARQSGNKSWIYLALFNSVFIQASTYLARPMISYKLIQLHASSFIIGTFGGLYALVPLLLAIPIGSVINKYGEARLILLGTLLISVAALGLSAANSVSVMIFWVALMGSAQFLCMVGAQAMFANRSEDFHYEKFFGYYTFSAALGQLIGPLIGSATSHSSGLIPRFIGHAFFAAAVLSFVGLIPILGWIKSSSHQTFIPQQTSGVIRMLGNPSMRSAMLASLAISSVVDILVVFLPVLGKERGFSASSIATILAIRALTSMASRVYLGEATRKLGFRALLLGSMILSSLSLLVAIFANSVLLLAIVIGVAGLALGVGQPMTMAWVSRISKKDERSLAISVRLAGNRFGQFTLPLAAGALAAPFGANSVLAAMALLIASSSPTVVKTFKKE